MFAYLKENCISLLLFLYVELHGSINMILRLPNYNFDMNIMQVKVLMVLVYLF
jgi:hypothetical protein